MNEKKYGERLRQEGLKITKHRSAILEMIENSESPLSADEIYLKLKEGDVCINLSTIYRTLDIFVSKGILAKTGIPDENKALYEICSSEHKHHLVCTGCRKVVSIEGCPFKEFEKQLQGNNGFDITGHRLEIYGVCPECKTVGKGSAHDCDLKGFS